MHIGKLSLFIPALLLMAVDAHSQSAPPRPPQPKPPATGQRSGEIIVYRARNFSGPAVSIPRDRSNIGLSWTVGSARVRGGTWQLCDRPNYEGACFSLSGDNANLGVRKVQSARLVGSGTWRTYGSADVTRVGWDRKTIRANGAPRLWAVRLCADRNRVQLRSARARFTDSRYEALHVPAQLAGGACTEALTFSSRRNVASVEVLVSAVSGSARTQVRLEGL